LFYKHPSVPYNPDVAATFFRSGLIESWGHGTLKILNECSLAQLPPPVFKYDLFGFVIEFKKNKGIASGKTSGKMSGKTTEKILVLISQNQKINIPELALVIGISERSIERSLNQLQKNHKLERLGGAKGGKWNILPSVF
jgi:ATP-dependent DNA helicase RecG